MRIWAKPEFINVFKKSQAVSTMKGKSHFMVRMPKITKDRMIINDLEEKKEENDSKMISLIHEIDELKGKIHQLEDNQRDNEDNLDKLAHLYKLGLIDENGIPQTMKWIRFIYFHQYFTLKALFNKSLFILFLIYAKAMRKILNIFTKKNINLLYKTLIRKFL